MLLWWLLLQSPLASAKETAENTKCGIYMAPSSIPGAGLGMYAGDHRYKVDDTVTMGDLVIPITEYEWHNTGGEFEDDIFLWEEYFWNSNIFPYAEEEGEDPDLIMMASPGVGAAANSYLSLANVEDSYTQTGRGMPKDSPGVGASTPYFGREFYATHEIPPGGEIFVDYGANYFKTRKRIYGYLPLPTTYPKTDSILKRYLVLKEAVNRRMNGRAQDDFWADYYGIMTSFAPVWGKSRVLNGLPKNEAIVETLMQEGGSSRQDFNRSIRDLSWLEENGQCMDNIKPGNSTNTDAGRGAFANRFIPKGGLVAPAPLIHIANYNALKMFSPKDLDGEEGKVGPDHDGPFNFQLIVNYCFGHQETTLLLCPYGLLTALINHSSDKANTRIQWSKEMRHLDWLEKGIDEWSEEYHTGLQIDFVALRDIEEDEEVLIDYGDAWEHTWQKHVEEFVPRENYIPSYELNSRTDLEYRTHDGDRDYAVNNLQLWCHGWYVKQFVRRTEEDHECRILENLGNDRYRVQLILTGYNDDERYTNIAESKILWNVPSDAFYFVDLPYTRDHYYDKAFRHAMMMPDDMLPEVWKNVGRADD